MIMLSNCLLGSRTLSVNDNGKKPVIIKRPTGAKGKTQPSPALFGVSLKNLYQRDRLPESFISMLASLYKHGPMTEGVFRRCASQRQCTEVRAELDRQQRTTVDNVPVLVVAALMKEFLRCLPAPVCVDFRRWADVARLSTPASQLTQLKRLVSKLPAANRCLLSRVMAVLHRIQLSADVNKMTASNLAVCIGPNLLRAPTSVFRRQPSVGRLADVQLVTQRLIELAPEIFGAEYESACKEFVAVSEDVGSTAEMESQETGMESVDQQAESEKGTEEVEKPSEVSTEEDLSGDRGNGEEMQLESLSNSMEGDVEAAADDKQDLEVEPELLVGLEGNTEALVEMDVSGFGAESKMACCDDKVPCKVEYEVEWEDFEIDVSGIEMSSCAETAAEAEPESTPTPVVDPSFVTPCSVRRLVSFLESAAVRAPARPVRRFQLDVEVTWSIRRLSTVFTPVSTGR